MTRDPNSYIAASAEHLAETLTSKNQDYAPTGEFSNFERSADAANIEVIRLIAAQIAIKMARIETLLRKGSAKNEPLKDSFLDLAGYATIGHAWLESREPAPTNYAPIEDRETIRNSADDEHVHNRVVARGEMDEPLGYDICGDCGFSYNHLHVWDFGGVYDYCMSTGCRATRDKSGEVFCG